MSDTVIKVDNLSKQYRIGTREGYRTFRETLVDAAKAPFQRLGAAWSIAHRAWGKRKDSQFPAPSSLPSSQRDDRIWALKDVSFEVKRGEVVGIIGRNGAGKSTLLKILSRITEPTKGRVELRGRVGSLLEVGTGFHPELTGHENVYMYGAILGMDRWEVTRKFDEIVAFAEIEKFIETPVKRYSSGMYMRLAFAVAAHMETEILLVDEVLAVGDAAFQKKCIGKMDDVAGKGRTVLFVSHNLLSILQLCSRCILLRSGELINDGSADNVTAQYINQVNDHSGKGEVRFDNNSIEKENNGKAIIVSLRTLDDKGYVSSSFQIYQSITFEVELDNLSHEGIVFTFFIRNNHDAIVYHIRSQDSGTELRNIGGKVKIRMTIPELKVVEGKYTVDLWLGNHLNQLETFIEKAISFEVINKGQSLEPLKSIIHETGRWTLVR